MWPIIHTYICTIRMHTHAPNMRTRAHTQALIANIFVQENERSAVGVQKIAVCAAKVHRMVLPIPITRQSDSKSAIDPAGTNFFRRRAHLYMSCNVPPPTHTHTHIHQHRHVHDSNNLVNDYPVTTSMTATPPHSMCNAALIDARWSMGYTPNSARRNNTRR